MAKGPGKFVQEVRQEGRKVTWPTRKETVTTTVLVFIMVFLASIFLFFADWVISQVIQLILSKGS